MHIGLPIWVSEIVPFVKDLFYGNLIAIAEREKFALSSVNSLLFCIDNSIIDIFLIIDLFLFVFNFLGKNLYISQWLRVLRAASGGSFEIYLISHLALGKQKRNKYSIKFPNAIAQTAATLRTANSFAGGSSEVARSRRPRAYIWQTLCALCGAAYLTLWAAQGVALFASRAMIVTIYGRLVAGQLFIFLFVHGAPSGPEGTLTVTVTVTVVILLKVATVNWRTEVNSEAKSAASLICLASWQVSSLLFVFYQVSSWVFSPQLLHPRVPSCHWYLFAFSSYR